MDDDHLLPDESWASVKAQAEQYANEDAFASKGGDTINAEEERDEDS